MNTRSADSFWDYSVALYSEHCVADICLEAQDKWGADVNILLLCSWLQARGTSIDRSGWRTLLAVSDETQELILRPLRKRRRAAKGSDIYEALKREELEAEKNAQAKYISTIKDYIVPFSKQNDPLSYYLNFLAIEDADLRQKLATILAQP
jgi:uncharacterized protein (TIGR02444 family)